jgi:hypothetical protein
MAERAAEESARVAKQGWESTVNFTKGVDEQYKIKEKTLETTTKAWTSVKGLFGQ